MKPTLYYFSLRGRGEPIRLTLSAANIDYNEVAVDFQEMKSNLDLYPCAQCPRFVDEDIDMVQSNSIIRHIARKHSLYGSSLAEHARVDMVIDAVESIKAKYINLIYQDKLSDEAKTAYWAAHCDAVSTCERNGGAHFLYLSGMLKKFGKDGYAVGGALSVADTMVFDLVDMHVRIWGDEFTGAFSELAAHHGKVAAVPGVASYLISERRPAKQNGNGLG